MAKALSEKYDEGVHERLRDVAFRSLDNERALKQLQKDVGKLQAQGGPREDALSDDEKCLIAMYRFITGEHDTPMRRTIVVTSDGDMRMGHE